MRNNIQDHGVRPVRRQVTSSAHYASDPATLIELAHNDDQLATYFEYVAWYYGQADDLTMYSSKRKES